MGFGSLAHAIGNHPLKQLTEKLSDRGIDFVQLALSKAIGDIDTSLGKLSPGLANVIAEQFDRAGIRIGVLGCYINPIHPDPLQRRLEVQRFKEHLRFARDFGTSIVATETGALTTYLDQDPLHYEELGWTTLRQTVEELAEEAERWGVTVGLEPVSSHTLSSPDKMISMLQEVPSPNLGVVFDPVNLLSLDLYEDQDAIIGDAFRVFGDRIILAHLKDFTIKNDVLETIAQGENNGLFHTDAFLRKLKHQKPFVDISMEQVNDATLNATLNHVRTKWNAL
ncbi:MAG: sugar phosphate isomerase/epimerase [Gorillibacterium sp.]|nr:sugar phosphate isomerase/epimerase [Gorillibacterium sp.]